MYKKDATFIGLLALKHQNEDSQKMVIYMYMFVMTTLVRWYFVFRSVSSGS